MLCSLQNSLEHVQLKLQTDSKIAQKHEKHTEDISQRCFYNYIHTHLVQIGPHGITDRLLVLLQHLLQLLKLVRAVSLVLLHTPSNVTSESTANFRHDLRNNVMSYCMYVHACTCRSCLLTLGISSSAVSTRTGQALAMIPRARTR